MVKPEWGTKRTCPKCGTRFYDLNKEDPVTCIECGETWTPEPVLKSKQPIPFEEEKKEKDGEADSDLADDDLDDIDDDEGWIGGALGTSLNFGSLGVPLQIPPRSPSPTCPSAAEWG